MTYFFQFLFLLSLIALPLSLTKPAILFRKGNVGRKKAGAIFSGAAVLFFILTGMTAPKAENRNTVIWPSQAQNAEPPAASKVTVSPEATVSGRHGGVMVKVVNVVDGDTIKIETGQTVRYIGIDTPETVHPDKPVQCYGKEASGKNTELVEGKVVELEKDVSETDKYNRLLRYVWLGDVLVNELLVREGYAFSSTFPPDVKYQNRFVSAQGEARREQKGLWSDFCSQTPSPVTSTPRLTNRPQSEANTPAPAVAGSQNTAGNGAFVCDCAKPCSKMSSCAEAQYQLNTCGCSKRDGDGDGIACDSDCQ